MTLDINRLPIVGMEKGQRPRYVVQYTLDGEVLCRNVLGSYVPQPLRTVVLADNYDHSVHVETMSRIHALIQIIRESDPGRQVPLPRDQILKEFQICEKKELQKIVTLGLLKEAMIPIVDTLTGKNLGSRNVVFYTPQGRAFIRKYVDPKYAITENT